MAAAAESLGANGFRALLAAGHRSLPSLDPAMAAALWPGKTH